MLFIPKYKKLTYDGIASPDKSSVENCLQNIIFGFEKKYFSIQEFSCRVDKLDDMGL